MGWKNHEDKLAYHREYYRAHKPPKKVSPRAAAKASGQTTFIPTKPCIRGHLTERTIAGACKECQRLRVTSEEYRAEKRRRYQANLEKSRAKGRADARKYRSTHLQRLREKESAAGRAARAPGIAERKCQQAFCRRLIKAWKDQKRAEKAAESEKRREAAKIRGRERSRAWRLANADRQRELTRAWMKTPKGRAAKKDRKIRRRGALISELSSLQRGRCAYCCEKLTPGTTHIDHIQPRAKGGANARRNYQLACAPCNITKSSKDPIVFAREIGRLL